MDLLINLDVDDLDAAVRFYTSAVPLRVGRRFGDSGIELLGASAPLYLLAKPAGTRSAGPSSPVRDYARHWTPVHVDFVSDAIEASVSTAVAAGATLEGSISTHRWGRLALLADPFGHGFCFVQFVGRGYDEVAD
jgi:predicted enzyme related to lactoylglutathione lyase